MTRSGHLGAPCRASVLLAVYAVGLGACYGYAAPPPGAAPSAGTEVRVTLTDAGSTHFASVLSPRIASVDGILVEAGRDSVVLRASSTATYDGRENAWAGERVAIPVGAVASLRTRQLDRGRSVLAVTVVVGALVASALAFRLRGDSGDSNVVGVPLPTGQ